MTIKQYGGVFGRNPTFNDVTIEGELTFNGDIDIDSDLKIDGNLDVIGSSTLASLSATTGAFSNNVIIGDYALTDIRLSEVRTNKALFSINADGATNGNGTTISYSWANGGQGPLKFNNAAGEVARFTTNGDLAFVSGKGIDFSATAGTGTSELFSDYEEGAWTPVVTGSTSAGTGTYINQIGLYTKVGRVVHFQCWLMVSAHTGTGVTLINGLPFTSNASNAKGTANLNYFANLTISASNTAGLQVANGQTYLVLKEFPVGGGVAGSVAIDPNMQINFSGSYTV